MLEEQGEKVKAMIRRITWLGAIFGILNLLSLFLPQWQIAIANPDYGYTDPNGDWALVQEEHTQMLIMQCGECYFPTYQEIGHGK